MVLKAYRVDDVRAADERAAEQRGWDPLMRLAAAALAATVARLVPADQTVLALVGPGNNGGDTLYAAAELAEQGRRVNALLMRSTCTHLQAMAAAQAAGVGFVDSPDGHRWMVDGIFGTGARPGLGGRAAALAAWQQAERPFTIAVDCPSGIGVDDGTLPGDHFVADHTITFGVPKPGLLVGPAAGVCGTVEVADIGLDLGPDGSAVVEAIEAGDGALLADALFAQPVVHKYTRGVVGVAAGSAGYPGAARLAVAGALAGPAGMVRFVGDRALADAVVAAHPEVVPASGTVDAMAVGPGWDIDSPGPLLQALDLDVPTVIDAGALRHLPPRLRPRDVLTPHAGELAAMLDVSRADVEADPLTHARRASEQWNATVLLKGPRTLVVSPGEPVRVNLSGTPWLATAGSGDVLAGLIGSMLAAGLAPLDAASIGAFLHGAAAVAANPGGPITASAVAAALPAVTAQFLAGTLRQVSL